MTSQKLFFFFFFFAFQRFGYHVSMENDEKHPQSKFGGDRFIWLHEYLINSPIDQCKLAWFITVWNQANLH